MTAATRPAADIAPDIRSASQRAADEAAARAAETGDWSGFASNPLCDEDGASVLLDAIDAEPARRRDEFAKVSGAVSGAVGRPVGIWAERPFRWGDRVYRLTRCEDVAGRIVVESDPPDPRFVAEVRSRIEADRFRSLNLYVGFGFVCFPEDYLKYQE